MRYRKENVTTLLAQLRVMGLPELGYWVDGGHASNGQVLAMRWKSYSDMEVREQKANWQQFQHDVNTLINARKTK